MGTIGTVTHLGRLIGQHCPIPLSIFSFGGVVSHRAGLGSAAHILSHHVQEPIELMSWRAFIKCCYSWNQLQVQFQQHPEDFPLLIVSQVQVGVIQLAGQLPELGPSFVHGPRVCLPPLQCDTLIALVIAQVPRPDSRSLLLEAAGSFVRVPLG